MDLQRNGLVQIDIPPVGVRVMNDIPEGMTDLNTFSGVSYCHAVYLAGEGREMLVTPNSIHTCQWVPVVLGFKVPENKFERSITEHLEHKTAGVYLARIDLFNRGLEPQVVIIRTSPANMRLILGHLGKDAFIEPSRYTRDATALSLFHEDTNEETGGFMMKWFNRFLDYMNRFSWWQRFTEFLFSSTTVSRIFDRFITRYMANMSMCRNSTVIPWKTGKANISNFCAGGIAWGRNSASHMTAGFPYHLYRKLEEYIDYPGKVTATGNYYASGRDTRFGPGRSPMTTGKSAGVSDEPAI